MNNQDDCQIVMGEHAIVAMLKKRPEDLVKLIYTEKARQALRAHADLRSDRRFTCLKDSQFRVQATEIFQQYGPDPQRVPGAMIAVCRSLVPRSLHWLWERQKEKKQLRVLALDQVTDLGNGAAILRTCAFYQMDALILAQKQSVAFSPQFFRIASGAAEHVTVVRVGSLSTAIKKMQQNGIFCFGLSEAAPRVLSKGEQVGDQWCAVLGAEHEGLSNAVSLSLEKTFCLSQKEGFTTLNVSVAAAVGLDRLVSDC